MNLEIYDIVVVKEDNMPSTDWRLGKIVSVYTGTDDKVNCAWAVKSAGCDANHVFVKFDLRRAFLKFTK